MRRADKLKGGKKCKFTNDHDILAINSPESRVNGPYLVVHKDANCATNAGDQIRAAKFRRPRFYSALNSIS